MKVCWLLSPWGGEYGVWYVYALYTEDLAGFCLIVKNKSPGVSKELTTGKANDNRISFRRPAHGQAA